jgi:hypothetical protein
LFFKSISVVDELVINNLSNERDRSLGEIFISLRHVKIIQEVDQNLARWWTVVLTSLLDNLGFKQDLERFGISVGVERHAGAESSLRVDSGQEILNVGGLSSTSLTDVKHTLLSENVHVHEESLASSGRGRNEEVLVKTFIFLVQWRSDSVPSNPLRLDGIEVVVEASINFNSYTDSKAMQVVIESQVDKRSGIHFGPPLGKTLIYFMDDLNMPYLDKYGTQSPICLVRQIIDYGLVYDRDHLEEKKKLQDIMFSACMNPKSGSFIVDPRLTRHLTLVACLTAEKEILSTIYF